MSSYSFWGGFFGGNPIREIMRSKAFTLEDLLKEDAGQFAAAATSDQELITYLSAPDKLAALLAHVLSPPVQRDEARPEDVAELRRRWACSASAVEALGQSFALLSALMADAALMEALFAALLDAQQHALVFHRLAAIVTPMLAAEPEQTLRFIWARLPNFVAGIVALLGRASAQDLIPLLKALVKAEQKLQTPGTWFAQQRLLPLLAANLAEGRSDQCYLDTALVLSELLIDSAMAQSVQGTDSDSLDELDETASDDDKSGDQRGEKAAQAPLVAQLAEPATLDLFFSTILASPRALIPALAFLRAYLTVTGQEEVSQEPIVAHITTRLPDLIAILRPSLEVHPLTLSSGEARSFGTRRLAVLEFLLALSRLNHTELDASLLRSRFYTILLDVLFAQSTNNIVHDLVAQAFFSAFNRSEEYIQSVLDDTQLIAVIVDKWAIYERASTVERELLAEYPDLLPLRYLTRVTSLEQFAEELRERIALVRDIRAWDFVGHLAMLANLVAGLVKHGSDGALKSSMEGNIAWTRFVDGDLAAYNARANYNSAHTPNANWSVDSESADAHQGSGAHGENDEVDDEVDDADGGDSDDDEIHFVEDDEYERPSVLDEDDSGVRYNDNDFDSTEDDGDEERVALDNDEHSDEEGDSLEQS